MNEQTQFKLVMVGEPEYHVEVFGPTKFGGIFLRIVDVDNDRFMQIYLPKDKAVKLAKAVRLMLEEAEVKGNE